MKTTKQTTKLIIFDLQGTLVSSMRPPRLNGSVKTLKALITQGFQLSIFTGANRNETLNILTKLNLYPQLFSQKLIITKNSFSPKPSPQAIKYIQETTNSYITYYIGNAKKDFLTAQNANIKFIYLGKSKIGFLQIQSLDQLLSLQL